MGGISKAVRDAMLSDEIKSAGPAAIATYKKCLKNGMNKEFAAMIALRQPPGSRNTDRAFCQGAQRQFENMNALNRKEILKRAKAAGINTNGKWYKGSLGRCTDPAAWVSSADDVLAVAKAKNLSIEGVIKHNGVLIDKPPKKKPLAPDLVREGVRRLLDAEPDTKAKVKENPKSLKDVVERVVAKHSKKK